MRHRRGIRRRVCLAAGTASRCSSRQFVSGCLTPQQVTGRRPVEERERARGRDCLGEVPEPRRHSQLISAAGDRNASSVSGKKKRRQISTTQLWNSKLSIWHFQRDTTCTFSFVCLFFRHNYGSAARLLPHRMTTPETFFHLSRCFYAP